MKQFLVSIGMVLCLASAAQVQQVRSIDPRAEQVFRDACRYLAEALYFAINAEVWREHVGEDGQKVQFSRMMDLEVVRPNRLHAEIHSPHSQRGFWYEGRSLTVLDRKRNFFSSTSMPAALDAALDAAQDQFGIDLPMIDLAVSDPFPMEWRG